MDRARLLEDLTALGGAGLAVGDAALTPPVSGPGVIRVGLHRSGLLPPAADAFDILLTAQPDAPRPWVSVADPDAAVARLQAQVDAQPVAAVVLAQVLRASLALTLEQALVQESLAYSMLLASDGFRAWRAANPPRDRPDDTVPRVRIDTDGPVLRLILDRPAARNAVDARMRDELCEALAFALDHPDAPPVELSGAGPAFSAGGDLDEFGRAGDPGDAHLIRALRSPARLAAALGHRLTVRLHGACVGAGIEVPAAAARIVAAPDAVLRLPEVGMGLIPGAGGTATLPRRIGRRRAAWMALGGAPVEARTARAWGLVDEVSS